MATPEIQKNAPAGAPVSKPSDALLKSVRLTIQQRWQEFDTATMKEAKRQVDAHPLGGLTSVKAERDKDVDFIKAKETFDKAIFALNSISTDEELKRILATPGNLASSINDLKEYLTEADARIEYNAVLSHTFADLTDLRARVTENPVDKKEAELAQAAIPTLAVATGAGALTAGAMSGFSSVLKESTTALGKEAAAIKESPLKKIVELFGFTESTLLTDFKAALQEKKSGGIDGAFAGIKIWFYGFIAKILGADITKNLTPEELKLAGIQPKEGKKPAFLSPEPQKDQVEANDKKGKNYNAVVTGITKISPEEAQKGGIYTLLTLPILKNLKLSEISQFSGKPKEFLDRINNPGGLNEKAADYLLRILFDNTSNLYGIVHNRFATVNPGKNIDEATIEEILSSVGKDIKILSVFRNIDITNYQESVENLGKSFLSYDAAKGEVSGELVEKAGSLGISGVLLVRFLALDNKQSFTDAKSVEALKSTEGLKESDKKMIDKIAQFGVNFIQTIKTNRSLNLGNAAAIDGILAKKNISFADIMKSYVLTGGESDMSKMDTVHKIGAYTSFMLIVGQDGAASGALTGSIINLENAYKLFKDGKDPFDMIPDDVKTFFKDTISIEKVWAVVSGAFGGMGDYVKEYAIKSPGLSVFLILAVLFLPVFSKRTHLASIFTGK